MALTTAQKLSCYEILGITPGPGGGANADKATIHSGLGIIATLTELDNLRTEVDLYIDNLSADRLTRIATYISEWDSMGVNALSIANGNVGDAGGITMDLNVKRDLIRERVQLMIPVVHIAEQIKRAQGPGRGKTLSFGR